MLYIETRSLLYFDNDYNPVDQVCVSAEEQQYFHVATLVFIFAVI